MAEIAPNQPTCMICVEPFNKSSRKSITCGHCSFDACKGCVVKYLLDTVHDPHCANCRTVWSLDFLIQSLGKAFVTRDLKAHREQQLLQRELSLLPATQPLVEQELQRRKHKELATQLVQRRHELRAEIERISHEIMQLNNGVMFNQAAAIVEKRAFIKQCPAENCKGFLSTQWKCGLCETRVCPDCHEIKGAAVHVCKPENLESARAISRDSRPCPKCGVMIHKIDGCFARDTPIPLFDGTFKMSQDIQDCDVLIGDDGLPRNIVRRVRGMDNLFKVTQQGGMTYVVNSRHKLVLCQDKSSDSVTMTVQDYLALDRKEQARLHGVRSPWAYRAYKNLSYGTTVVAAPIVPDLEGMTECIYTDLTIEHVGRGDYYGWTLDNNQQFVLPDFTVMHNCSQMYCPQPNCHTIWNWNTGRVENGPVHNPHAIEYMQRHGIGARAFGDVPCGGMPDLRHIRSHLLKLGMEPSNINGLNMAFLVRELNHMYDIDGAYYRTDRINDNADLRIRYMLNEINEDRFKQLLQQREKATLKNKDIYDIIASTYDLASEMFRRIQVAFTQEGVYDIVDELRELLHFSNVAMLQVGSKYNSVVPQMPIIIT